MVTVTNQAGGQVITHGDGSHAVLAQSIGGGGGVGGEGGGVVGRGGSGGYGGTGGAVILNNYGTVSTTGDNARSLYAQSVGGGGGHGGRPSAWWRRAVRAAEPATAAMSP